MVLQDGSRVLKGLRRIRYFVLVIGTLRGVGGGG